MTSPLDDPSSPHTLWAVGIALVATIVGGIWKAVFGARRDLRTDQREAATQEIYDKLIRSLEERVQRLSDRLDEEIMQRRQVESENVELRVRVAHLESEVKRLGGAI